jgi:Na+/proline symporter
VGAGYFVACAGIAVWATRRTKTAGDFFVAGRGIGVVTMAVASMASVLSAIAFIGGPGLMYRQGLGAVYLILSAGITSSLTAWVLARRLRLLGEIRGAVTIPEAVGIRYRSHGARRLAGLAMVIATVGYVATNFLALGLVVDALFEVGRPAAILIGAAVVVSYSVSGGMLAGVYTDLFQGSLMAIASILVFATAVSSGGGIATISAEILAADPGWFGPWGHYSPLAALSFFFVLGLGALGQPHLLHKFYMLRHPRQLRWYPMLMTVGLVVALLLWVGVGLATKAAVVTGAIAPLQNPDDATATFLLRYAPDWLAGLVFAGVAAAIMSTVNSFLNLAAAALTRDLPPRGASQRGSLQHARMATLAVAVVALGLAMVPGQVVVLLGVFGWGLFASTFVPALAFGLVWPGATRVGALASMAVGIVLTLGLESLMWAGKASLPAGVTAAGVALLAALVTFFAVSWATRVQAAGDLDADVRLIMER